MQLQRMPIRNQDPIHTQLGQSFAQIGLHSAPFLMVAFSRDSAVSNRSYSQLVFPVQPLGPLLARARVLDSQGYSSVIISAEDWALLKTPKAKAAYILSSVKAGVPSASSKVSALSKKLEEPFDAFAE